MMRFAALLLSLVSIPALAVDDKFAGGVPWRPVVHGLMPAIPSGIYYSTSDIQVGAAVRQSIPPTAQVVLMVGPGHVIEFKPGVEVSGSLMAFDPEINAGDWGPAPPQGLRTTTPSYSPFWSDPNIADWGLGAIRAALIADAFDGRGVGSASTEAANPVGRDAPGSAKSESALGALAGLGGTGSARGNESANPSGGFSGGMSDKGLGGGGSDGGLGGDGSSHGDGGGNGRSDGGAGGPR